MDKKIMDEIKEAGWVRFKPVEGQAINEKDIKKVFKMVDMDKSGAISQLVKIKQIKSHNLFKINRNLKWD